MGVGGDARDMAWGPRRWRLETSDLTNQQTSDGSGMVWSRSYWNLEEPLVKLESVLTGVT